MVYSWFKRLVPGYRHVERYFFRDAWKVGVVEHPLEKVFLNPELLEQVQWVDDHYSNEEGFFADPFAVQEAEETYRIYVESYVHGEGKGDVSEIQFENGVFGKPKKVLEEDHHLSYPMIIEDGESTFMTPESYHAKTSYVYRQGENGWERWCEIFEGKALADTTYHHDGVCWWAFSVLGMEQELHAWHAKDLKGPWIPHAMNPLKKGSRGVRCAGNIFRVGDDLIRPTMDNSGTYGGGLVFQKIETLNPESFVEKEVSQWSPLSHWPWRDGMHTISGCGGLTLFDAKRVDWAFWGFAINRLKRSFGVS